MFHRGTAETEQATPNEIDMLADRYAAGQVATDLARIASNQDAAKAAEEAKYALGVGIEAADSNLGQTGWRVSNTGDYAVTSVKVRTTNAAKITVYFGSGPKQVDEYEEAVVGAQSVSKQMFRPADSVGLFTEPSEHARMAVTFTDANGQGWERVGAELCKIGTE
ncbi:hypothetical protein B1R94_10675 [Mycolicibacterium litorale]|nr:hypothetical protein B1R94_10675 [Mycolicibacterium litorale]